MVESLWIVCHGYGQLASYFIKNFESLNDGKNLIVAPEGLHRFYWQGYTDRIAASWMTKEDRQNDIKDYVNFLDVVSDEVLSGFSKKPKINVLGFSQGTATACRWLCMGKLKADNLILWAGAFPHDLPFEVSKPVFNQMGVWLVVGDNDQFMEWVKVEEYEKELKKQGIDYRLLKFDGKHEVPENALLELAEELEVLYKL